MNLKRQMMIGAIGCALALTIATTLPASAASAPTEYFTGVQTSLAGPQTVVAAGPVAATGTDKQLSNRRDQFVFPNGTLTVRHERATEKQTFDSATCVGTFTETGTYVVASGTGAYAHVTGSGRYRSNGEFQGCDRNQPPTEIAIVIEAHGPLTLG